MKTIPRVLLMIESSRESGRKLISGIADYAHHFGPWQFHWEPQGVNGLSRGVGNERFDGLLARDIAGAGSVLRKGLPCVVFSFRREAEPEQVYAGSDDAAIAAKVGTEFFRRGFRNFAFCGDGGAPWAVNRGRSFEKVLASSGASCAFFWTPLIQGKTDGDRSAAAELKNWLRELPKPVALMAANDDVAHQVVLLCAAADVRVPEDCAVIGVDNDPVVCGLSDPQLSSVSLDQYRAGYEAAAALHRMMRGEAAGVSVITAAVDDLVRRQSSDLVAVDDPAVARAIRFIQSRAGRRVFVDEVARVSGTHRRTLERRFKIFFNQGINERCREMRAEYLEKLFRDSSLTLEQIAEQCDFSEAGHLSRFYSALRGETPSAYRKRVRLPDAAAKL